MRPASFGLSVCDAMITDTRLMREVITSHSEGATALMLYTKDVQMRGAIPPKIAKEMLYAIPTPDARSSGGNTCTWDWGSISIILLAVLLYVKGS